MQYISMEGITRYYRESDVLANNNVNFDLKKNEVHALVGENGAGKTTLMKILYGLEKPDSGRIFIRGSEAVINDPLDANSYGIGMVHQHFKLVPDFTVTENIVLGLEPKRKTGLLDMEKARSIVKGIVDDFGFSIDPVKKVESLSVGEKQQTALARMLYRRDEILILDEPTSVLAGKQIDDLFVTLKKLVKGGRSVILISHKLDEIMAIADRITVLGKGSVTGTYGRGDVTRDELSKIIVGRNSITALKGAESQDKKSNRSPSETQKIFELKELSIKIPGMEKYILDKISFTVHSGEIVGVTGADGNGLKELEDALFGMMKITGGKVYHNGQDITNFSPGKLRRRGCSYVPGDRMNRGSSLSASLLHNLVLAKRKELSPWGIFNTARARSFAREKMDSFSISGNLDNPLSFLSGGNIQKTILARELSKESNFIIFSRPTWGLDTASGSYIYDKIKTFRDLGKGVLLLSSNIDEIISLSDTIIVLYHGKTAGIFPRGRKPDKELMGEYMLGVKHER